MTAAASAGGDGPSSLVPAVAAPASVGTIKPMGGSCVIRIAVSSTYTGQSRNHPGLAITLKPSREPSGSSKRASWITRHMDLAVSLLSVGKRRGYDQGHSSCLPTVDVDLVAERLVDAGVSTSFCEDGLHERQVE